MSAPVLDAILARLRFAYEKVTHAWGALHVERHGAYSLKRLRDLHDYQLATSLTRAWTVVVLTPLPCLALITLLDAIPLRPPSEGIASSHLLWLRGFLMHCLFMLAVLVQLQDLVPRLGMTITQLLWVGLAVAVTGSAYSFSLACLIGYPLPFTIVLTAPGMCTAFGVCIIAVWGKTLKNHPVVRHQVLNYYTLVLKTAVTVFIYAAFNAGFSSLSSSSSAQTALSLLLPVLKLAAKNWTNRNTQRMGDWKPEMVVFNIEVFHMLYVVFCMQSATSRTTIVVMISLDAIQACATLRRVMMLSGFWRTGSPPSPSERHLPHLCSAIRHRRHQVAPLEGGGTSDSERTSVERPPQLIRLALHILETTDPIILKANGVKVQRSSSRALIGRSQSQQHSTIGIARASSSTTHIPIGSLSISRQPKVAKQLETRCGATVKAPPRQLLLTEDEKRTLSALSEAEQCENAQRVLRLLHLTEFVVLVEYVEVTIPVVYCLYLLVMDHLPNRVYYAQLKNADGNDSVLDENILNISLYALLELLSFLTLTWLLGRRLAMASVHQLAFVLERQWHMVQAKLVFWVMFAVQSSLEHFGADYTFQFKWLH